MKLIKLGMLFLLCLLSLESNSLTFAKSPIEGEKAEVQPINLFDEEMIIFELVNKEREKRGLYALSWNSQLADLARRYSNKMAQENFFSHYDKDGNSVPERATAMKITKWKRIGENLFMCEGYEKFSQIAVKGWMQSRPHRQNILEENYNQTGIGIGRSRNGSIYVTQIFLQK